MREYIAIILALVVAGGAYASVDYTKVDPVAEVRGIWIDAGAVPKTDSAIREMVRAYARANFNMLIPETICRGYAIYPSRVIPRDPRFAGAVDPLPVMIDEAHKLGIEVHAWVWVFRAGYTKDKGAILTAHPNWAEKDKDGDELSPNGGYWISPAIPQARDFLAELFAEVVTKYDFDGLHLDYVRYETEQKKPYGYSNASRSLFIKQYGVDPVCIEQDSDDYYYWNKFRERLVNTFVQRIYLQTKALRPDVLVSAAVSSYPPDARLHYMQNWPNWAANGWVGLLAPMSYSSDDGHFGRLILRQKEAAGGTVMLAEGIGLYLQEEISQTIAQIAISREKCAQGQVIFAASYVGQQQLDGLKCGPYPTRVTLPFRNMAATMDKLSQRAQTAQKDGNSDLADYYCCEVQAISDYIKSMQPRPYVPPTPPPLPALN
ncbi:MAG: glycoside hydrolase family 10 protein [Armatimonadota bacterium]